MSRVVLNESTVDEFVTQQTAVGMDVAWDGWTLEFFKVNPNGFNDKNGAFKNGQWGVLARVEIDSEGLWKVPVKYVNTRRKGT